MEVHSVSARVNNRTAKYLLQERYTAYSTALVKDNMYYTRRPSPAVLPEQLTHRLQLLTGSSDRSIRLYNPAKASTSSIGSGLVQTYSAHGYEVLDISVTEDNARFASVGGDKQVFLWDVATARTLRRWSGHFGRVNCVGFGGEEGSVVFSGMPVALLAKES